MTYSPIGRNLKSMEYQKAVEILQNAAKKYPLTPEEKEALDSAIGLLSMGAMVMNSAKAKKAKRDKGAEW